MAAAGLTELAPRSSLIWLREEERRSELHNYSALCDTLPDYALLMGVPSTAQSPPSL